MESYDPGDLPVNLSTVMPARSDGDVMFCLQLLSKTLSCTLHLS